MKKIVLLSLTLLTTGFSKDLFGLGLEAYDKGEFDEAAKQWQNSCDGGDIDSCSNLGLLYENGQGVEKDYYKAAQLWQKGCGDKFSMSCYNLGTLYNKGQGVKQDYSKSVELYKKACNGGYNRGCFNLGAFYLKGKGAKQDYHIAKEYFDKACKLGFQSGCDFYKKLNEQRLDTKNNLVSSNKFRASLNLYLIF